MEHLLETYIANTLIVASLPILWIRLTTECNVVTIGDIASLVRDHLPHQDGYVSIPHRAHTPWNALSLPDQSHEVTDVSRTRPASISWREPASRDHSWIASNGERDTATCFLSGTFPPTVISNPYTHSIIQKERQRISDRLNLRWTKEKATTSGPAIGKERVA